ncbi:MAG: hypothetical protein ABWX90_03295 [Candidatus Saccharimonadales bacterium]
MNNIESMSGAKALREVHNNTFKATENLNPKEAAFDKIYAKMQSGEIEFPRVVDIANIKRDNIVLERYLHIGDVVVMHMDKEAREWGRNNVPDGTVGIVVGFKRFTDYYARINNFGHVPGTYERNGIAAIRWMNIEGTVSNTGAGDLRWLHDHEKKMIERREDKAYSEAFEYAARIGDLPELPFWEMDTVRIIPRRGQQQPWSHTDIVRIESIDYHRLKDKRTDGSPMPIYNVTPLENGYGRVCLETAELELVERGNLWKWYNNKRDEIKFDSLEKELAFHFALDKEEQIRCEQSGGYHWPFSAILPALEAGIIDIVKQSAGMFGASDSMSAHKLTDPELSERVRQESIRGYKQDVKMRIVGDEWNDTVRHYVIRRAIEFNLPFINVMHESGYVDTTQLELLGIPVVRFNPADAMDAQLPSSYIYFSPKSGAFDIAHASTHEIDEEAMRLSRAFKRNRDDHFEVRVLSDKGWSEKNRDIVIAACKAFGVPFADRAAVGDDVMKQSDIQHIVVTEDGSGTPLTFEIDGYVFFTHRGMKDLPFYVTVKGE